MFGIYKKYKIYFISCSLFIFLFGGLFKPLYGYASNNYGASKNETKQTSSRLVFVGMSDEQANGLARILEINRPYSNFLSGASVLQKRGDYERAISMLDKAMIYARENGIDEWNVHWDKCEIYEILKKKNEFIEECDWLIKVVKSEVTKKELIARKNKFLADHPA
jgi:hypothetical protein